MRSTRSLVEIHNTGAYKTGLRTVSSAPILPDRKMKGDRGEAKNHGWEKYYKSRDIVAQTQAWVPYT